MLAEYVKSKYPITSNKMKFLLEIGIPSLSITCLFGVTVYVTYDAVIVLLHPTTHDDVDITFLYGFATANFLVDIFCGALFCIKGSDVLFVSNESSAGLQDSIRPLVVHEAGNEETGSQQDSISNNDVTSKNKNLNMVSALTHVVGDTLRTFSVLFAAIISDVVGIRGDICDAWAAIIVSATILVLIINMSMELYSKYLSLSTAAEDHPAPTN